MQTIRHFALLSALSIATLALPPGGCEQKSETARPAAGTGSSATTDGHGHKDGDGHDHGTAAAGYPSAHQDEHGHGPTTELGEQTVGGFTVKASRDGGITPGGDAPIDVWVTGGSAKVAAVRFWIGTQDGRGSIKARAELERDNWHTHAEIPDPMPMGSKLWVEIESDTGEKIVVGFDLNL